MAKGLGSIMAAAAMEMEKSRIEKGKTVACPLCGREMTYGGVAWFCYAGTDGDDGQKCSDLPTLEEMFFESHPFLYADDFQGEIVAAVVIDGKPEIEFRTVRGGYGRTNIKVNTAVGSPVEEKNVPALIQEYGWTWMDWAARFDKGAQT